MQKFIHTVTVTGADDRTNIQEILDIQKKFPFVEWGILLSKDQQQKGNVSRFPSVNWIASLLNGFEHRKHPPKLSAHICGRWVRDICKGEWSINKDMPEVPLNYFKRIQLNFACYVRKLTDNFIEGLIKQSKLGNHQFIFQLKGLHPVLETAQRKGINAASFFDISGGHGVTPDSWAKGCSGYAGGLGPHNLTDQLLLIEQACQGNPVWIDSETFVRNDKDEFDLGLVTSFLEIAEPFVL